jgi:hypothetical protein
MCKFGMRTPILADKEGRIVCGYARWLAAQIVHLARGRGTHGVAR